MLNRNFFSNKSILITGGTGSLGKALTSFFIKNYSQIRRLIIFSRDEQKHYQMNKKYNPKKYPFIRYYVGDVRDYLRLERALEDVDYVIHTAAMKHVDIAEYNPDECIKTNVMGGYNVINACIKNNVKRVVALSTDKACAPINLYGATKLTSDKLFVAANNFKGKRDIKFSVVRYGNVMGSNGSVIPFFLNKRHDESLPITDENMTRFNITLEEGVGMVIFALLNSLGGEIFIPKIPSYNILELVKAISPKSKINFIGVRPGEKIHEEMIASSDSLNTYDIGDYYTILPSSPNFPIQEFISKYSAKKVKYGFNYSSGKNKVFLNYKEIRLLIKKNIDPNFKI